MTLVHGEHRTAHHRRIVHWRVTNSCSEDIRIDGAVVDLDAEARRNFIPIINELHQATTQVGAGEGRDGGARRTAQLEVATGYGAHCICEAGVVRIGDAEVRRGERDGLAFADGERPTGHHRRVIARGDGERRRIRGHRVSGHSTDNRHTGDLHIVYKQIRMRGLARHIEADARIRRDERREIDAVRPRASIGSRRKGSAGEGGVVAAAIARSLHHDAVATAERIVVIEGQRRCC